MATKLMILLIIKRIITIYALRVNMVKIFMDM